MVRQFFLSFDVIFLQMKFWLQLCNFQQYTCLKAKLELLKKKKKVGILCKSGFLPFSLPVGLVAFKTEQC